ncbi:hypothetical protein B0H13DRAFT_2349113 [Mycena leptocephala]|nr:hypothetical protein B0H13DRAFT_2349113 [Mycena leptocephala]
MPLILVICIVLAALPPHLIPLSRLLEVLSPCAHTIPDLCTCTANLRARTIPNPNLCTRMIPNLRARTITDLHTCTITDLRTRDSPSSRVPDAPDIHTTTHKSLQMLRCH